MEKDELTGCCKRRTITPMKEKEATQTIKVWVHTHDALKVLAALRKETMMETLDQ
jgi:hypothetical protein